MGQTLASNKKARQNYEILDKMEAGIVLIGSEVKSAKTGIISLQEAYIKNFGDELYIVNWHIPQYLYENIAELDTTRSRKLLMHRKQINKIIARSKEKGLTILPLSIYLKNGLVKVEVALGKGKKDYDKRRTLKERDMNREAGREMKRSQY